MLSSHLFVSLLAAAGAFATVLDRSALAHRALSDHLQSRQTTVLDPSTFPAQCQKTCVPIINTLNTCNARTPSLQLQCLCTTNNGQALKVCLDCLVDVVPSQAEATQAQSVLTTFNQNCREFNLPPYSIDPIGPQPSKPPPVSFPSGSSGITPPPASQPVPSQSLPSQPFPSQPQVPPPQPSVIANPNPTPQPSPPAPSSPNTNSGNGGTNTNTNDPFAKNGAYVNQVSFGAVFGVVVLAMIL